MDVVRKYLAFYSNYIFLEYIICSSVLVNDTDCNFCNAHLYAETSVRKKNISSYYDYNLNAFLCFTPTNVILTSMPCVAILVDNI